MTRHQPGSSRRSVTTPQPTNSTTPMAVHASTTCSRVRLSARQVCTAGLHASFALACADVCAVVVVPDGDVVCDAVAATSGRHEFARGRSLGALSLDGTIGPAAIRQRLGADALRPAARAAHNASGRPVADGVVRPLQGGTGARMAKQHCIVACAAVNDETQTAITASALGCAMSTHTTVTIVTAPSSPIASLDRHDRLSIACLARSKTPSRSSCTHLHSEMPHVAHANRQHGRRARARSTRQSRMTFPSPLTVAPKLHAKSSRNGLDERHRLAHSAMQRNGPSSDARGRVIVTPVRTIDDGYGRTSAESRSSLSPPPHGVARRSRPRGASSPAGHRRRTDTRSAGTT